jgi:hypothetical protein
VQARWLALACAFAFGTGLLTLLPAGRFLDAAGTFVPGGGGHRACQTGASPPAARLVAM